MIWAVKDIDSHLINFIRGGSVLVEAQSTFTENVSLRLLMYLAQFCKEYVTLRICRAEEIPTLFLASREKEVRDIMQTLFDQEWIRFTIKI